MRAQLRRATSELHARLEALSPFGPGLDRAAYVSHLERRLGFQAELEPALERCGDWEAARFPHGWDDAALLRADLRALGVPDAEIARVPRCHALPAMTSFERALGCAYVVEGARLGGRTIAPAVAAQLGLGRDGVRFLAGDRGRGPARFTTAIAALEAHARSLDDGGRAEIVEGARACFLSLVRWLAPEGDVHG